MKRKLTLVMSSWGIMLISTIGLSACTGTRETALREPHIIPPRTVGFSGPQEMIVNPPDVSPHFIPMAAKDEPRHKVYGNNYWKKLNRHIKDALPSYSAEKYMKKEETSTASNNVKQNKSSKDTTTSTTGN